MVPPHLRMPWIAVVSFGYVCLLSFTRGTFEDDPSPSGYADPETELQLQLESEGSKD